MNAQRFARAAATAAAAATLIIACADAISGPRTEVLPFAIAEEQRTALIAAVRFATRGEVLAVLDDQNDATGIATAFTRLADRIADNDLNGARRALDAARAALNGYRRRSSGGSAGSIEIEMMSLTLEHVALLAASSLSASLYVAEP
jgi:hypothetical protein